jgi:hypothetical protein
MLKRIATGNLVVWGLVGLCGCAVLSEKHRFVARYLDENLAPTNTPAKALLSPVAIPVGVVALAVDGLVINPVVNVPQALDDASFVFKDVPSAGILEIFVFPMRIVTFPVVFLGSEVGRCCVPFEF